VNELAGKPGGRNPPSLQPSGQVGEIGDNLRVLERFHAGNGVEIEPTAQRDRRSPASSQGSSQWRRHAGWRSVEMSDRVEEPPVGELAGWRPVKYEVSLQFGPPCAAAEAGLTVPGNRGRHQEPLCCESDSQLVFGVESSSRDGRLVNAEYQLGRVQQDVKAVLAAEVGHWRPWRNLPEQVLNVLITEWRSALRGMVAGVPGSHYGMADHSEMLSGRGGARHGFMHHIR